MTSLEKLNKKLDYRFGAAVRAEQSGGCLRLRGRLARLDDIAEAGRIALVYRGGCGLLNDIELIGSPRPEMELPELADFALEGLRPDVMVIGAGPAGCAAARELRGLGLSVLVVDKGSSRQEPAERNPAEIFPLFAPECGPVGRQLTLEGCALFEPLCKKLGVNFERTEKYVCFSGGPLRRAALGAGSLSRRLGLPVKLLGRRALHEALPTLERSVGWGLVFPTARLVSPSQFMEALSADAAALGADIRYDTAVLGMAVREGQISRVETNRGSVFPRLVLNAAGPWADQIAEMARDRFFSLHVRMVKSLAPTVAEGQSEPDFPRRTALSRPEPARALGLVRLGEGRLFINPCEISDCWQRECCCGESVTPERLRALLSRLGCAGPAESESRLCAYSSDEDFILHRGICTDNLLHLAGLQRCGITAAPAAGLAAAMLAADILSE